MTTENKPKILIAEDDPTARLVLRSILQSRGYQVLEAPDGEQAWDLFDRTPVRIVISDWMMPGLDGLGLLRRIRQRPKTDYTYFILVTATTGRQNYLKAMEEGVDDFLSKPLDHEAIAIRLRVAERIVSLASRVALLEGIIPVCSYCRRVRRDDHVYEQMEAYIEKHSAAVFSHGICPDCLEKHFPEPPSKTARPKA